MKSIRQQAKEIGQHLRRANLQLSPKAEPIVHVNAETHVYIDSRTRKNKIVKIRKVN